MSVYSNTINFLYKTYIYFIFLQSTFEDMELKSLKYRQFTKIY
jgi:hypothetical protein